jgi:hypothetical protein
MGQNHGNVEGGGNQHWKGAISLTDWQNKLEERAEK